MIKESSIIQDTMMSDSRLIKGNDSNVLFR